MSERPESSASSLLTAWSAEHSQRLAADHLERQTNVQDT